jgi:hypothetical protein
MPKTKRHPKPPRARHGRSWLAKQLDKDNADAPFLVYAIWASDAWKLAQQAASVLPSVLQQTKPCPEDWKTLVELSRKAADEWSALVEKVEAMEPPATRRTKRIVVARLRHRERRDDEAKDRTNARQDQRAGYGPHHASD